MQGLAEQFVELYTSAGNKLKPALLDIMTRSLKYERRLVIKIFQDELAKKGLKVAVP